MNRERRRRELQVKIQLERLETRWLMRAGVELSTAPRRVEPRDPTSWLRQRPRPRGWTPSCRPGWHATGMAPPAPS